MTYGFEKNELIIDKFMIGSLMDSTFLYNHLVVLKRRGLIYLALASILFFLFTLYQHVITLDEVWFAEQAYWLANNGFVRSDLFEGYPLFEGQILVYHKLHVWQGALAYKLFGWNAYIFKSISLIYILVFLASVFYFLKTYMPDSSRKTVFLLFLILFFTSSLVITHGYNFRPEIMMMCTGFLSFMCLYSSQQKVSFSLALLSGLLSGVTALFHINGFMFIAAGGVLLVLNKNYKLAIAFFLGAVLGFLPYCYEIMSSEKFHLFLDALLRDPAVSKEDNSAYGWLMKLLLEYKRFTHYAYGFAYLLIFLIVVVLNRKEIRDNHLSWQLFVYTLLLTFFMALITTGRKVMYLLYTFPYMTLLIAMYSERVLANRKVANWYLGVVVIYLVASLESSYGLLQQRNSDIVSLNARVVDKYQIKQGDEIFAPFLFIFNEIDKVRIQSLLPYILKYDRDPAKMTLQNVFEDIYFRNKTFAILDPDMLRKLKFTPEPGVTYFGYQCLGQEESLYIFKRV